MRRSGHVQPVGGAQEDPGHAGCVYWPGSALPFSFSYKGAGLVLLETKDQAVELWGQLISKSSIEVQVGGGSSGLETTQTRRLVV